MTVKHGPFGSSRVMNIISRAGNPNGQSNPLAREKTNTKHARAFICAPSMPFRNQASYIAYISLRSDFD